MGRIIKVYNTEQAVLKGHKNREGALVPPREVLSTSFQDKRQSRQLALRVTSEIHAAEIAVYVVFPGFPLSDISLPSSPD